jgi:shikimate kinase
MFIYQSKLHENFIIIFHSKFNKDIAIFVAMKIILIGYMGSGKSNVGEELSKVIHLPFIDLDSYIEQQEGKSVSAIFTDRGEIYFRRKEAEYLKSLLASHPKLVLATGGGTPCYGDVMSQLLEVPKSVTVYLNCSVDTLTTRLWKEKNQRPLISHLTSEELLNDFIRKHLFERSFVYNKAAIKINCDTLTTSEIVEQIVLKLL